MNIRFNSLPLRSKTFIFAALISLLLLFFSCLFLTAIHVFESNVFQPILLFLLFAISFIIVFLFLKRFQVMLVAPVTDLVNTARIVSEQKDYTVRVCSLYDDEFRTMSEAFNEMLDQIQSQDMELKRREKEYRKLYEESKKAEKVYRSLIHSSADPIIIHDIEGQITYVSPAFTSIFKWTAAETPEMEAKFVPPSEHHAMQSIFTDLIKNKKSFNEYETKRYTKEGDLLDVNISVSCFDDHEGKPAGILMMLRDMSERKRLEAQLMQSQKMEAIGTLAGGIAHDFNNILGAMMGYSEMMMMDVPKDTAHYDYLQQVMFAGMRAKELVKQILAFSRQKEQNRIPMKVDKIITEALNLLRASLPTTIDIRLEIDSVHGNIMADPTQVHQILMNLCTNAAYAMENKGELLVTLEDDEIMDEGKKFDIEPGKYIKLVVSDTGKGMDQAIIKRIFEPYFTTKEQGKGTGMGLAVVHGIVKSYGGAIRVHSDKGIGTKFEILFPKIETHIDSKSIDNNPLPTGNERILFVDDEKILVELGSSMLERLGYQVITRTSPVEAVEAFKNNPNSFDLVITDMTMPQMTGDVLAKEIMKIKPDMPVILCTGYSELMTEEKASASGIRNFFMKPFVLKDLADTIRTVLDLS
jgi:PAS domain S-box-containing protein